jgi:hypothetical protein
MIQSFLRSIDALPERSAADLTEYYTVTKILEKEIQTRTTSSSLRTSSVWILVTCTPEKMVKYLWLMNPPGQS